MLDAGKTADPLLMSRQANERTYLDEVSSRLAKRLALVPWLVNAPVGSAGLLATLDRAGDSTD